MNQSDFTPAINAELAFTKDISPGARGMAARRVQEWVSFHGFATSIDGDFGTATQESVRRFQNRHGLGVTGKVDRKTWDLLTRPLQDAFRDGTGKQPSRRLESVARLHLKQHPVELGGDNLGPWVRVYTDGYEGKDWLWCAGFVRTIMRQAYRELDLSVPIKGSLSCDTFAAQAMEADLFVSESELRKKKRNWSELGEVYLFLVRRTPGDWQHIGIGLGGSQDAFTTIEGNTNDSGSSNGYEVCTRIRSFVNKDFIIFS